MSSQPPRHPAPGAPPDWVVVADVVAKVALVVLLARVVVDPGWGNLEGKAPFGRAVTYPVIAFVVPVVVALRRGQVRYPWVADLLLTLPAFSDVLGNRLDLYDRVDWFDDAVHLVNTGLLSAAVVLLLGLSTAPLLLRLAVSVAAGMTMSVAWELWEYDAFVTRSAELSTAYVDTVGDLTLGWVGAVVAGFATGGRRVRGAVCEGCGRALIPASGADAVRGLPGAGDRGRDAPDRRPGL